MKPHTRLPARLRGTPTALAAAAAVLLAGCVTVGPDYDPPAPSLPAAWQQPRESGLADGAAADGPWWQTLGDPLLDSLVARALQDNLDLRQSLARLQAARALRGIAAADAWPTIDVRATYEHREDSENTPFGAFVPRSDITTAAFDAGWELDLWGRVRRSVEAADRDLEASTTDVEAAALTVAAEVARTYVELRAAQRRLQLARDNLQLQEQTLQLVRARLAAGIVVERDVAQAATNVEQTRSRLPQLETASTAARNRLAVLLGAAPGTLPAELAEPRPLPRLPASVAVGAPADLLRRRPDVHAAERRFAAEVARIGVAEADLYPRLTLLGSIGLSSDGTKEFFEGDSAVVAFGPSLRWNLFDGGRLRNRVRALEANAEAAQVAYEQTVLLALEETENALTRFVREQERRAALQSAAGEARRAVTLAQTQYREGLSDFQAVLDSERVVATIEDDLASSDAAVATHLIAVHKALGGGWTAPATATAAR